MSDFEKMAKGRLSKMGGLVIVISLALLWRFFDISVIQHSRFLAEAEKQQRYEKTEFAQRGKIYVHDSYSDQNKLYPLAFDVKKFEISSSPKIILDRKGASEKLAGALGMEQDEVFDKINNDKIYANIKNFVSLDEARKVEDLSLVGVSITPQYSRYYPENNLASHILGFVNRESNGNYGFEGHYNNELRGLPGEIVGIQDSYRRLINFVDEKQPQDGTSYILTIDRSVQYFVEKKLKEYIESTKSDSGLVVIIDVKTGGVVAMAALPNFDPNKYYEFADLNSNIFINPVIAGLYEPGSIIKPIIMSGALSEGVVTKDTKETFSNMTVVDGYEIHTAENTAFGEETMSDIIKNSDNVGMVWVSEKLGKDNIYKYVKDFNLLDKTRIDLDSEVVGNVPEFKYWKDINRSTIAFGQGVSVTPIALASAYATIANKGVYIYPHIVDKMVSEGGLTKSVDKQEGKRVITEEAARDVIAMMVRAVDEGHAKKAGVAGFDVAGKTGTAQISAANGYEFSESGLGIYNHSLAGIAPASDPRYAMIVRLERPKLSKYAESTAAPLFGDISSFLLNYYYRLNPTR